MTNLARVKVDISNFPGGPGVNVLHFSSGTTGPDWIETNVDTVYDEVYAAYIAVAQYYAPGVVITVGQDFDIVDSVSGNLIDVVTVSTPSDPINGAGASGAISRGQAVCLAYYTDNYTNGKRLRGRSFLGPVAPGIFASTGLINQAVLSEIEDEWTAMSSGLGPRLAVYHRPSNDTSADGYYGDVVTVIGRQRPSNLRSRQD
jgi:hypothetical protein